MLFNVRMIVSMRRDFFCVSVAVLLFAGSGCSAQPTKVASDGGGQQATSTPVAAPASAAVSARLR
jgi:hypothetical protein